MRVAWGVGITSGWGDTEVFMEVSSRRLAIVQHRHLPAHGLLSLFGLLGAFLLTGIKRNQAESCHPLLDRDDFAGAAQIVIHSPGSVVSRPKTFPTNQPNQAIVEARQDGVCDVALCAAHICVSCASSISSWVSKHTCAISGEQYGQISRSVRYASARLTVSVVS